MRTKGMSMTVALQFGRSSSLRYLVYCRSGAAFRCYSVAVRQNPYQLFCPTLLRGILPNEGGSATFSTVLVLPPEVYIILLQPWVWYRDEYHPVADFWIPGDDCFIVAIASLAFLVWAHHMLGLLIHSSAFCTATLDSDSICGQSVQLADHDLER
jgi:hypothetical protein